MSQMRMRTMQPVITPPPPRRRVRFNPVVTAAPRPQAQRPLRQSESQLKRPPAVSQTSPKLAPAPAPASTQPQASRWATASTCINAILFAGFCLVPLTPVVLAVRVLTAGAASVGLGQHLKRGIVKPLWENIKKMHRDGAAWLRSLKNELSDMTQKARDRVKKECVRAGQRVTAAAHYVQKKATSAGKMLGAWVPLHALSGAAAGAWAACSQASHAVRDGVRGAGRALWRHKTSLLWLMLAMGLAVYGLNGRRR